ncbi:MAG: cell division protein FtsA [Pseudomonadota bacterium]
MFSPTFRPTPKVRAPAPSRSQIVSVLDVGTTKVCCMIARLRPRDESEVLPDRTHSIEVLGCYHLRSQGIKSGVIVDLEAAETVIRNAVDGAERMAGITVDSLIVNVSAGRLQSQTFNASVSLSGHAVEANDIARVLAAGGEQVMTADRATLHAMPIGHTLDGNTGIRDPRGMLGDELGIDMHVISADIAPMANLELVVNRAMLSVETMVATPYASGLSALVGDEAEIGCACIDMGGGTTTISIFHEGNLVYTDAIALGGGHVTTDLARGLGCAIDEAERLKVRHGSALPSASDDRDMINVPLLGMDDSEAITSIPRAHITRIVRPRVEETLETIRDRLSASGYAGLIGKRIVLTGGASQLNGVAEVGRRIIGRNVRLGRPMGVSKLPAAAKGPSFATAVGLLIYPQVAGAEQAFRFQGRRAAAQRLTGTTGTLARMGSWLKESF